MSSVAKTFLIIDIFRAAVIAPVLVCVLVEVACLRLDRSEENDFVAPKDYAIARGRRYDSREFMITSIIAGMCFCGLDILLALTLHKSITERLRIAYRCWFLAAVLALIARGWFLIYLYDHEDDLGWRRIKKLTTEAKLMMTIAFYAASSYEVIKVFELIVGLKGILGGKLRRK